MVSTQKEKRYLLNGLLDDEVVVPTQSVFDHSTVTLAGNNEPGTKVTCGFVFNSVTQGRITGISFFKSASDVATSRQVALYSAAGVLLRSGTSSGEAAGPGWVTVNLDTPYTIEADVKHVAAVHYPSGSYPRQASVFANPIRRGDLLAESQSAAPNNGRYAYGTNIAYPDGNGGQASYGIDVAFQADAYPTAQSTGSKGALTNQSGAVHLTMNGQKLENVKLNGWVIVEALNCEINNCEITNPDGGVVGCIRVDTNASPGTGLKVTNCTINGGGITTNGIMGEGTFSNNKIIGCDNGINVYGPSLITENYIVCDISDSPDPHFDGIEMNAGTNVTIKHNTILINQGQTSAVMMNNEFGPLQNIKVIDNLLKGGGYTIYCDNGKSGSLVDSGTIRIAYNKLGTGLFGYYALYTSGVTPVGNVDAVSGAPV